MPRSRAWPGQRLVSEHPPGLYVLVGLKLWEVFSYSGMRAFLVLYMIAVFQFDDARAALTFGSYGALVLATSLIGGFVADRLIGTRLSILCGAVIIMLGHLGLALEAMQPAGPLRLQLFFASLAAIAGGTGLLKPNVLTMIGRLYDGLGDRRREAGFYAYYLGINIGGLLAPLVCAWLASTWGWAWGFAAAAIGMAAGLTLFLTQQRHLIGYADRPQTPYRWGGIGPVHIAILLTGIMLGGSWFLVQQGVALGIALGTAALIGAVYLVHRAAALPHSDRRRLAALFALLPSVILYVIFYEQVGTTITLFAERLVDRRIGTITVATGQIVALNSLMVIAFIPLLALVWRRLERRGRSVEPPVKFAIGFALIATSFAVLGVAAQIAQRGGELSLGWIVLAYGVLTLGELCIAPIAYATTGRLANPSVAGVAMGMTLLAFAIGNFGAGLVAGATSVVQGVSTAGAAQYSPFFWTLAAVSAVWAVFLVATRRWTIRRMAGA